MVHMYRQYRRWKWIKLTRLQARAKFLSSSSVSNANSEKEGTFISTVVADSTGRGLSAGRQLGSY